MIDVNGHAVGDVKLYSSHFVWKVPFSSMRSYV
jgi:hypothetical protein